MGPALSDGAFVGLALSRRSVMHAEHVERCLAKHSASDDHGHVLIGAKQQAANQHDCQRQCGLSRANLMALLKGLPWGQTVQQE